MKSLHRISWIFVLVLFFSCGGSNNPLPEEEEQEELEVGLESLADKYGLEKLVDTLTRMSKKQ